MTRIYAFIIKNITIHFFVSQYLGTTKVQVTRAMKHLQQLTESGHEVTSEELKSHLDYNLENNPIGWSSESSLTDKYNFVSELSR